MNQIFLIPTNSVLLKWSQVTSLDGQQYTLFFYWNQRMSVWFMDIYDVTGTVQLLVGIPLLASFPLIENYVDNIEGLPPGNFQLLDNTGQNQEATQANFGNGVNLYYQAAS